MNQITPTLMITKLMFTETGTYNDMALRPYHTNVDRNSLHAMQEATRCGQQLGPSNLAGVAGSVVRPSTEAQGIVSIANGFGESRLRFIMEVKHQNSFNDASGTTQYLTGYTDYMGGSHDTGNIDPRMQLYINNSILTRWSIDPTPVGNIHRQTVTNASQVLTGDYVPDHNNLNKNMFTMRPEDVFLTIGASTLGSASGVFDTRPAFSTSPMKLSERKNGSAPSYLSKLLTRNQQAMRDADNDADDLSAVMAKAAGMSREGLLSHDPFFSSVQRLQTSLVEHTWISYGELCGLSPGLDQRTVLIRPRTTQQVGLHQRGQSEHWGGTTTETIMATVLTHSVPALMMDLMITKLTFMVTNQTYDGQYHITILDPHGFAHGLDLTPFLDLFRQRLEIEVLRDLTRNNMIAINITGMFDIVGDTSLEISINNGPSIRYVTPSFCDALMAPVMTNDRNNLAVLANDVSSLAGSLEVDYSPSTTAYPPLYQPQGGL